MGSCTFLDTDRVAAERMTYFHVYMLGPFITGHEDMIMD